MKRQEFSSILRTFENAEKAKKGCPKSYGIIMQNTAKAFTFCVLKKLDAVSDGKLINRFRRDIMQGEGEGVDLVQVASLAIMYEVQKAHEREGANLPAHWTEKPYTIRTLDKRVYIQSDDSAKWKDVETVPAREIFKAIRQSVRDSTSVQVASQKYAYIEELATDETGAEEALYRRLPAYHTAVNDDGTASPETVKDIDKMIDAMNLTPKQFEVLALRLKGYGYKAIASKLGIKPESVLDRLVQIQRKFKK